jgi:cytochrome c551/c552
MKTKIFYSALLFFSISFFVSCNSNTDKNKTNDGTASNPLTDKETASPTDSDKGIGKFTNVELTHPLDAKMITAGEGVYNLKCASCHKLSDEKLVGPGWKDVTKRRKPEWLMNFATNTEEMLEKDPTARNLYEVCLVKMPNQQLTDYDARSVLEYMRKNDGEN